MNALLGPLSASDRTSPKSPIAFISHASEDKAVVRPLAEQLRARGVDAWLDEWEIKAGDSLVKKIFSEGIESASVFIVMLSRVSVTKPWVLEELDAGVVRKIEDKVPLIPVLLDDVTVPAPLRHLLYLSVPKLGLNGVVDGIVNTAFSLDTRPPLGPIPGYATATKQLLADPVDDAVLSGIVTHALEKGEVNLDEEELVEILAAHGIGENSVNESVAVLRADYRIEVESTFGGYSIMKVTSRTWLEAVRLRGVDVDNAYKRLLVRIVNEESIHDFEEVDPVTLDALLDRLEREGLVTLTPTFGGTDADATVAGKRLARSF